MKQLSNARKTFLVYLCAALALIVILSAVCAITHTDPRRYKYESYLLQAQAWLRGETSLQENYGHLELAIYNDKYYVSFPPVPSVPMVVYTLIFGDDVPGGLFQKIYVAIACMLILSELLRAKRLKPVECALWAVLFCAGSALLPITLIGGVWYEAQILAFLFSIAAIICMRRGKATGACLLYALSIGCRPFAVLLGPVLLAMYLDRNRDIPLRRKISGLMPGICLGLVVAAHYAFYNYIRFGDPLEFGHNYLPEFVNSTYGQISVHYLLDNLKILLFGSPYSLNDGALSLNIFGFSMFLSCPVLICNVIWLVQDLRHRQMNAIKWLCLLMGTANCVLLCMHRTLGGFQFGMRYALEIMMYSFIWLLSREKLSRWELALMLAGFASNFIGGCVVHI